ncbi:MAG: glycoside hydrolase/phage tail family protein [Salibaculum sp.]|uniref:baseplate multidomain protein megatron n=1 Tax=Salibaculum sp. TaxID=2855480 RepID=UPI0028709DC9|nr:glycoside hydrolase/phage tail family protein [Salibaculum sp.]MDR9427525.1 glycoside hydrolase/phage tail family protein [Salibaculum sp.]MDR9483379.1 glycoside hydrolase/phage tail family protein [Salibaculum sp.]
MATIVLSAAGMAAGGAIGGSVLGLSSAVIGRAVGATLGRVIDQRLLGAGSEPVEVGRLDRLRLTGAGEGTAIAQLHGRMRITGQVIGATEFREHRTRSGGGKGGAPQPATTEYSYSISLGIALCEGEVARVGRVWADGQEVAPEELNMRLHPGTPDQLPDPKIEAVEGTGQAPAYRGTAYVVMEDLALGPFGNRVPQFTFEVMRPDQGGGPVAGIDSAIRAVSMIPGTGEYALATTPVYLDHGFGNRAAVNLNAASGKTDFVTSLDALQEELPHCGSAALVVSWFGDDLRCDACTLRPKVDQKEADGAAIPWRVSGLARAQAQEVAAQDGVKLYGGTPADAAVIEAIGALRERGLSPVFYPFVLMDQITGNTLTDPWTGAEGQPHLPWRGRITASLADGLDGSPMGTAQAEAQVAAFLGQAQPGDFSVAGDTVSYHGPAEWSYRRMILHYAHLCAAAGGVDAFLLGSELRGLTQIRGADGFPFVAGLVTLLEEVRAILGRDCKISYAADWSEYHGYQPPGTADKLFHLDALWAHPECDFIGIDNYLPLSDWREGEAHADAHWGSIYNADYLRAGLEGGEYYDWYYHSPQAEAAQIRTPITDGAGEPWVWRAKDIRGWWQNPHYNRIDGIRQTTPTAWQPEGKPIWFTEVGCPAVDKGTNQPTKFVDPKSSESGLPRASTGVRDDFIQRQYLSVLLEHYGSQAGNPVSSVTGQPMVDTGRIHVWAWDARPYPAFPGRADLWSDADNYTLGHWINGRVMARSLASVVAEICTRAGLAHFDVSQLYGVVRGYSLPDVDTGRAALQPLMLAYGFDAIERDGRLVFRHRTGRVDAAVAGGDFAVSPEAPGGVELTRAQAPEVVGRVQVSHVEADGDYEVRATEAVHPGDATPTTARSDLALALTRGEGLRIAERWLAEVRLARDTARFALPPSRAGLGPGDVLRLPEGQGGGLYRVDLADQTDRQVLEAVRVDPSVYDRHPVPGSAPVLTPHVAPIPVELMLMDLPLMRGDEGEIAPHAAVSGVPWPGSVALHASDQDAGYALERVLHHPAVIGVTQTPMAAAQTGTWDRGTALRVRLIRGTLDSLSPAGVLGGGNLAAIGDGGADRWELFQFAEATLVGARTYDLRRRLRGQAGSDGLMPETWPAGSVFVLMDGVPEQIALAPAARGTLRHYRYGPATRPMSDPSYQYRAETFRGNGLRPYPVAHLRAVPKGDDLAVSWVRRTRIEGDSWDQAEVPLGEARERYRVQVRAGETLLREVTRDSPHWIYDAGAQASDGAGGTITLSVAQISDRYGPGPARDLTVSL